MHLAQFSPFGALSLAASAESLVRHPVVEELFTSVDKIDLNRPDRFLATHDEPGEGFSPFRLQEMGTDVLFINDPQQLHQPELIPLWNNGLGLVLFRNVRENILGAIFVHGVMRTAWSSIAPDAWQALGGVMAFEDLSLNEMLSRVLSKGMAMTPKWRFIDRSLLASGRKILSQLGGAKAIFVHEDNIEIGVRVTASVAAAIGIYISGSDQNMIPELCALFASCAPNNFMGARPHPNALYAGDLPSSWTARGTYAGIQAARAKIFGAERVPLFIQGFGNTGQVIAQLAQADGYPIAGVVDVNVDKLLLARAAGVGALFLDITGTPQRDYVHSVQSGIRPVRGLRDALHFTPEAAILVPAANAHPITRDVARYLGSSQSQIRAIIPIANNVPDLIDGSPDPISWYLQHKNIFVTNDSSTNRLGAIRVASGALELDETGLQKQVERVGADVAEEYDQAFRQQIPPQLWRDQQAFIDWNRKLDNGQARGGRFHIPERLVSPEPAILDRLFRA